MRYFVSCFRAHYVLKETIIERERDYKIYSYLNIEFMKVDNFELIHEFLEFKEPTDFYHLQVMLRKKDNPYASANNKLIKAYYIKLAQEFHSI